MQIYKPGANSVTAAGQVFYADADGIIDIPDKAVTSAVWQQGFTLAKGIQEAKRQAEDAAKSAEKTAAKPVESARPEAVPAKSSGVSSSK